MKTLVLLIAIALCAVSPVVYADEASQRELVEYLFYTTKVDQAMKQALDEMRSMMARQLSEAGVPEDMKPILDKYQEKLLNIMEQSVGWENSKDDIINIYVHSFSEEELKGMLVFYKSPVGRSVTEKMPVAMRLAMATLQKRLPELQEKIKVLCKEMTEEVKTEMEKKKPVSKMTQGKDAAKVPATREAKWGLVVGRWFGSTSTKEGGTYMWIADNRNDGSYTVRFRTIDPAGKKMDRTESGEWGVSGDVFFQIYKTGLEGDKTTVADPSDPSNRDAYKLITLTEKLFAYENMDNGTRFEARKVASDFIFPE